MKMLCYRLTVKIAGTPVEFPKGKPKFAEVRFSTQENTGNIYIASNAVDAKSETNRFIIVQNKDLKFKISDLSGLWLNSDNDKDSLYIFSELED